MQLDFVLVDEYCEAENIIHAASLLPKLHSSVLHSIAGNVTERFEKNMGVMLQSFVNSCRRSWLLCSQQLHRYGCNITAEQGLPLKLNAQWVKSPKCGWIWMRKGESHKTVVMSALSAAVFCCVAANQNTLCRQVADGEKVDVSTLGKEIGCHDTVATEMTKAPLAEYNIGHV